MDPARILRSSRIHPGTGQRIYVPGRGKCEPMKDKIADLMSRHYPEVQAISRASQAVLRREMPYACEFVYHDAINYSLSTSAFDRIAYIARNGTTRTWASSAHAFRTREPSRRRLMDAACGDFRSVAEARNPPVTALVRSAWEDERDSVARAHHRPRERAF